MPSACLRWSLSLDEAGEGPCHWHLGRKIHQRRLQVISETGENMVTMHRVDVLRLMDENGSTRLMTGKHIHEEQLKLCEKQKAKTGPVQVKELTFSSDIGNHDLLTKLRQVQNWLDKKHRVRITLRTGCMEHVQPLVRYLSGIGLPLPDLNMTARHTI
uniref:Uncharacterized protein n=1 Tax=Oncorhynchus tshawytscha TaxID=74940 RepID=A0A8C8INE6_ONCTS